MGHLVSVLSGKGRTRGFTLVELLIVILIVGVLAVAAIPLYFGYLRDSRSTEAKALAGALWTAVQANALGICGSGSAVSAGYPRTGLSSAGGTSPVRWSIPSGSETLTADCSTGAYSTSSPTLFTVVGVTSDVDFVRVQLQYSSAGTPPSKLQCSTDYGGTYVDC